MNLLKSEGLKISALYFVFTRLALLLIGYCVTREFALHGIVKPSEYIFSDNKLLSIFGTYDTGWYLRIVQDWYPNLQSKPIGYPYEEYSFFPLYPALIKALNFAFGINYFYAGLLISNLCLVFSGYYLFSLTEKFFDKNIAQWSVVFLYSFPVSFIYSGVFTEALYLILILIAIYNASIQKWLWACLAAMLLIMCRPIGVFIILPLGVIYLKSIQFNIRKINGKIFYFSFLFLGVIMLGIHHYIFAGGKFSVFNLYGAGYKLPFINPVQNFINWISNNYFSMPFLATFTIAIIVFWFTFYKQLKLELHLIMAYSLFVPMCYTLMSMPRMCLVAFPIFMLLARVSTKYKIQIPVLICSVLLQGYLFVCWCLGFGNVI